MGAVLQNLSELGAVASVLQQPAESFGNDPSMEMLWAIKAYEHAETYFNIIISVDTLSLRLSRLDDEIYEQFRREFPDYDVGCIDENLLKSPEQKIKWRAVCNKFEHKVDDWNMGSLLRLDASKDVSDTNTTLVPRIQFLAVEIARNREGYNVNLRNIYSVRHRKEQTLSVDQSVEQ